MAHSDISDVFQKAHGAIDWVESHTPAWVRRVFTTRLNVKAWSPPVWVSVTREIDEPFRKSRTLIIHVLPHTAYGIGFWSKTGEPEHEALLKAVRAGREVTDEDLEHFDEEVVAERSGFGWAGGRLATRLRDAPVNDRFEIVR